MACIELRCPDTLPMYFPCASRLAIIPPDSGEELLEGRLLQREFPPAGSYLLHNNLQDSPTNFEVSGSHPTCQTLEEVRPREQPHLSNYINTWNANTISKPITHNTHHRATYLKARAQNAPDHDLEQSCANEVVNDAKADEIFRSVIVLTLKPHLRKRSAFVIDEEMKSQLEARADTPHISEVIPGEDVGAPELAIQLEAIPLTGLPTKCSASLTSVTSVPEEIDNHEG